MKKLVAICSIFALVIGTASCNSDDNDKLRKEFSHEGQWISDSLFYKFGTFEGEHKFLEFPIVDGQKDGEQVVEEILTLTNKTATLEETTKAGSKLSPAKGEITNKVINLIGEKEYNPRTIEAVTDSKLTVIYNIEMRGAKLPVTVTYKKIK